MSICNLGGRSDHLGAGSLCRLLNELITPPKSMNQISEYFECPPPTLDEYLSAPRVENARVGAQYDLWGDGVQAA